MSAQIVRLPVAEPKKKTNPRLIIDGLKVKLYQRDDASNGGWWIDYKDPNTGKRTRLNTERFERNAAEIAAEEMVRDRLFKARRGIASDVPSFAKAAHEFIADLEHRLAIGEADITANAVANTTHRLVSVMIPFFGEHELDVISPKTIADYHKHRMAMWKANRNKPIEVTIKSRVRTVSRAFIAKPSAETQARDEGLLRRVFKFAARRQHITLKQMPDFEPTKRGEERRGCYSDAQWATLVDHLRERAVSGGARYRVARTKLYYFVLLLAHTGMRVGEAMTLRHLDVRNFGDGVSISVDGKTGSRLMSGPPEVRAVVAGLAALAPGHLLTDRLFDCENYHHQFKAILTELGMERDYTGLDLTLYSLRHMYITKMLYADHSAHEIADQCGTSITQIENHYRHILRAKRGTKFMVSCLPPIAI